MSSETHVALPAGCPACKGTAFRRIGQRFKFKTALGGKRNITVIHSFECDACGHVWTQMEHVTNPLPPPPAEPSP